MTAVSSAPLTTKAVRKYFVSEPVASKVFVGIHLFAVPLVSTRNPEGPAPSLVTQKSSVLIAEAKPLERMNGALNAAYPV